jgi:PAS domain-containing protein
MDPKSSRNFPHEYVPSLKEYLSHPDHLRQLVDGLPTVLVAISPDGELFPLNQAAKKLAWDLRTEETEIAPGRVCLEPDSTANLFSESKLGPAGRAIGTLSDVTEVPRAEAALRQSEEKYEKAFALSGGGIEESITTGSR